MGQQRVRKKNAATAGRTVARFFERVSEDPRIGTTHIGLFAAIVQLYSEDGLRVPVPIRRSAVMKCAKISGIATYHKCLRDLAASGCIRYTPSYDPAVESTVQVVFTPPAGARHKKQKRE